MNWKILCLLLPLCFNYSCQSKKSNTTSTPKTPFTKLSETQQRLAENAILGMHLNDSLLATVFVAEPQLVNPTNIDIDAFGRIWAIETVNYRNDVNIKNPYREKGDRILVFEDTDHDGKADTTFVFYQGEDINAALGICVLGNKVIISDSPNVFVFTDENNDLVADKKELLFSNIGGENHDHGIHACVFGPDGKLYFTGGNVIDQIADKTGHTLIARDSGDFVEGLVFRCNEDGSNLEVVADNFRNNFELAIDSYGNIWQTDNDDDGTQSCRVNYVVPFGNYGYVDQVTKKKWRTFRVGMHTKISKRHWHQNDPGVFPNMMETGSGGPSGLIVYEGKLLPPPFRQQMINAMPGHQELSAYTHKKQAAGFITKKINLLKSEDKWCRPVDLAVAPDGSLFMADWYDSSMGGHYFDDTQSGRIF
ncbi:MAG TPA: dehydrogenase, partial [Phaeodactylibacter sp.]|nr:dehydrogenase [Phaeodactylibacter sp.]